MTSLLCRRLQKLEAARIGREPRKGLVLFGTADDVERQYQDALAAGRTSLSDPVMRIILAAPAMDEGGRVAL